MKRRALWIGGFLIALALAVGIIGSLYAAPRDEMGKKIDTSAEIVLQPAFEIYSWFTSNPLLHENTLYSEALPYCKVVDERFSDFKELSSKVKEVFSNSIATRLLESGIYIDIDGELYVKSSLDAEYFITSSNLTASKIIAKEVYSVVSQDPEKIAYRAEVVYTTEDGTLLEENALSYDFVYEKVNGKWVFTQFDYYK